MLVITFAVVLAVNRIPVFGTDSGTRLRTWLLASRAAPL
jgi:hypothetical protein